MDGVLREHRSSRWRCSLMDTGTDLNTKAQRGRRRTINTPWSHQTIPFNGARDHTESQARLFSPADLGQSKLIDIGNWAEGSNPCNWQKLLKITAPGPHGLCSRTSAQTPTSCDQVSSTDLSQSWFIIACDLLPAASPVSNSEMSRTAQVTANGAFLGPSAKICLPNSHLSSVFLLVR